jgi:deoxyribodipyrimidine photolyase
MIKAINAIGTVSEFRERVWELMPPHKNGWREIKEGSKEPINVPTEITEFQAKKKDVDTAEEDKPEITSTHTKGDENATMEIMKEYLESKGIKYHPNIGYDKLKAKYDACRK